MESFEAGARRLGLAPHEVAELVGLRGPDDCARVGTRMAGPVGERLAAVQAGLGERLAAQAAAGGVAAGTGVGPIAEGIELTRDAARLQNASALLPDGDAATAGGEPLVCTLDADGGDLAERLDQWRAVLAQATGREPVDGGIAVTFGHDVARTAELARLLAAEYACCSFASYHLTIDGRGVRMEVRAPAGAGDGLLALFGTVG